MQPKRASLAWTLRFALTTALLLEAVSIPARGAVGRTPGSFAVSNVGAATYSVPIWAPPGPNGLQPNIALSYNSQAGAGFVGVGWTLTGLSSISRCNRTYAQDGVGTSVQLTTADALCLDGKRLRLTSGTYGQANSTYQTEVANFSNVTAFGTQGAGPAYFIVKDHNGRSYQYGNDNGNHSRVTATAAPNTAYSWLLNEVDDPSGNSMIVTYTAATGAAVPSTISWTPTAHGGTSYAYTMTFGYGTNVDKGVVNGYIAGTSVAVPYLLSSISVAYGGTTLKKYVLTYQVWSATGRYDLTTLKECADDSATNCLLPTSMTYQANTGGLGSPSNLVTATGSNPPPNVFTAFDVDGDGRTDFVWQDNAGWNVAFGTATGFSAPHSTGITTSTVLIGDVDGTGSDGFLAQNGSTWWYYKWNGTAFTHSDTHVFVDSTTAGSYALADLNGDGLPDLITTPGANLAVRFNNSSPGAASFSPNQTQTIPNIYQTLFSVWHTKKLDFYGSGQRDIIGWVNGSAHNGYYVLHWNGTTLVPILIFSTNQAGTWLVDIGDFNDDGCTDILTNFTVVTSACNGTNGSLMIPPSVPGLIAAFSLDWDGDGRRDLIFARTGSSHLWVALSNGSSFGPTLYDTNLTLPLGAYVVHNPAGDGLDGIITEPLNAPFTFQFYSHASPGVTPDLLSTVTDGFNNSARLVYGTLAQAGALYSNLKDAPPGTQNYVGPMSVVSQVTMTDPSATAANYQVTYSYYGAWMNLQGRGFMGFNEIDALDSRNQVSDVRWFRRDFPYSGTLSAEWKSQPGSASAWTSKLTNTFDDTVLDATSNSQRHFPHLSNSKVETFEFGGTLNGQLITTASTNYSYDSSTGNTTNVATTVTDNDSTSPYASQQWTTTTAVTFAAPDTGTNWCLTLPSHETITNSWAGSTIVRKKDFNLPDYAHCRVNEVVTEPGSGLYAVTEDRVYDAFGNISTLTVTGVGAAARVWTLDWGGTGQFPVTLRDPVSNALGGAGYRTVKGYDYGLGVQTSEVTQSADGSVNNAPATSWQYDAFGRRQRETRPDGTYSTWAYNDCASVVGCPVGSHALAVTQTVFDTDQSVQTDGTTWYDPADRPARETHRMLANGTYSYTGIQYDSLGRVHFKQIPCGWTGSLGLCSIGVTTNYDILGRQISVQRPVSASDLTLLTTNFSYAGRTTVTSDPKSKQTTRITTAMGWLGVSQDNDGYRQMFSYDAFGNLVSVSDSLSNSLFTARYDYGIQAFQREAFDMDLDLSTGVGQHRYLTYDAFGDLTSWTDAKGQSFVTAYDGLSRPLSRSEKLSDGTVDLATSWTWGSSAANHNVGQLAVVSANGYTETYAYDLDARPAHKSITIPSDMTYTYDIAYNTTTGLIDSLSYPGFSGPSYQLKLSYAYQNGMLFRVTDGTSGVVYWTANATNPRGEVTQETLGNSVVTNRVFNDVTGLPGLVTSGLNGTASLQNDSYLYDEVGNLTQRQNNNAGLTENFYYDNLYRLDHSTLNGTVSLQMGYSGAGNITSRSDLASGATWTYDTVHRHAVTVAGNSTYSYTYDSNGNATSRDGLGITWTSYNHPAKINNTGSGESVEFAYNQDHERWSAVYRGPQGTETTYIIGGLLEKVILPGGITAYRHFIYAGGTKIAIYNHATSGDTLYYLREDHQGGVGAILNSDGSCYAKESFTPFGLRRSACTWSGAPTSGALNKINAVTRHGYTFQTALGNMGLNDMNGRIQDAVTGRFLSPDPYIEDPNNTQSFNRYSYVLNNPLSRTDPTGFYSVETCTELDTGGRSNQPFGDAGESLPVHSGVMYCVTVNYPDPDPTPEVPVYGNRPSTSPPPSIALPDLTPTSTQGGGAGSSSQGNQDQLETVTVTAQQCHNTSASSDFGDQVTDAIVGFGDAFLIPILVRDALGIGNGTVNTNSSAYSGGQIAGTIEGLIPFALEGAATYSAAQAARGTPSILNANRYFRIGPGRWGGGMTPRVSSPYLPGDGHLSLTTRLPPIPPLGALASGNGC